VTESMCVCGSVCVCACVPNVAPSVCLPWVFHDRESVCVCVCLCVYVCVCLHALHTHGSVSKCVAIEI